MGNISAFFVRKIIAQAHSVPDRDALFTLVGLDGPGDVDPSRMVTAACYARLFEAIAESEAPDIGFHLRTSASMRCEEYGAVGLAWKTAPTLRHSFQRMDRYALTFNKISVFKMAQQGGEYLWTHYKPQPERLGHHLSNEAGLGTFLSLCREATTPDFAPLRVQFRHQDHGTRRAAEAFFGCEVTYGARIDALVLSADQLDARNNVGDESVWRFFSSHLADIGAPATETCDDSEAARTAADNAALDRRVEETLTRMLSSGVPTLGEIGSELGVSARTLQRRLAERNTTYQAIVADARLKLCQRLLANSRYSLAEVAFLAGFSEQSAFARAFKRCSGGQTPGDYRQAMLERAMMQEQAMAEPAE